MSNNTVVTEAEEKKVIDELLSHFTQGGRSVTIQALQAVQENFGYLSPYSIEKVAVIAGVSPNTIYGVATFYSQFLFNKPGRHKIAVCRGTACHVREAPKMLEVIERVLGIKEGQTTPDGEYSLETVACIGACSIAPTMRIDEDTYGQLTPQKIEELLGRKSKKEETVQA